MVFLPHGLEVGFFTLSAVIAALSLARADKGKPTSLWWLLAGIWLLIILLLSKNLGAVILAVLFVPLIFLGSMVRSVIIFIVAITVLAYPMLRGAQVLPLEGIREAVEAISPARAQSFGFRLNQEEDLLAKANEKPLTGWGGWGRNRLYDEYGQEISITDGLWIIEAGRFGWLRYLAFFGLLALPLMAMTTVRGRKPLRPETIALGLIMAANLVYLIPNSALSPVAWVMAGAIAGFIQFDSKAAAEDAPDPAGRAAAAPGRQPRYTRFAEGVPRAAR
jgi:hypothetical protein